MKKLGIWILIASILFTLTACGKEEQLEGRTSVQESQASKSSEAEDDSESVESGDSSSEAPSISSEADADENEDDNTGENMKAYRRGYKLLDEIYDEQRTSLMISPLSLNLALGLLSEGATGESKEALDGYLGADFSSFASDYMQSQLPNFNMEDEAFGYSEVFEVANSIWMRQDISISNAYKEKAQSLYSAEVDNFDVYDPSGSASKINSWCKDKTHDMISSIVEPDAIVEDLAAVLMNTVYFESPWMKPWTIYQELMEEFTDIDGNKAVQPLMHTEASRYFENDKATAFSVSYMNGMEFIGILPKQEGEFSLESLDIDGLLSSEDDSYDVISATMPRLNFETSVGLSDILSKGKLACIFDDETLDFIEMTSNNEEIHVDEIIQKTKLELDEKGTKAAAVTSIMMMDNCSVIDLEPKKVEVVLNRPFAFLIYDRQNDVIAFVGKVVYLSIL